MTAKPKSGASARERKAPAHGRQAKTNGKAAAIPAWPRDAIGQLRRNPLLGAGVAAGLGFVVGGGLASRTALRLLGKSAWLAFQVVILPALLGRLRDAIVDEVSDARLGS